MKALKFIGLALLAVLLLMALGLAVVAWRFDSAWATQKLTQAVYEQKQRVLKFDGDLALSFFPSVGVKLGGASLSERNSAQEFARVESARVSVRVLPLLQRQLVVDRIELDGLRARIQRGRDGRFNFDDLLRQDKADGRESRSAAQDAPIAFDVAGIGITRAWILFRDDKAGRAIQLSDVSLETGRLSQAANGPFELAFKASSDQPKLSAAFNLGGSYRYDLARKQYTVEGVALTAKGQLAQTALEAKVTAPAVEGVAAQWRIGKLDAQWSLKQSALTTQGRIGGAVEANLERQVADLSRLAGELVIAHPQLPVKQLKLPLDASIHADWGRSQATGHFSTRIEDSAVQGKFQVAKFAPLAAAFDVSIDRLNVDRYLPQTAPAKTATGPATPAPAGEAAPIDFSFLRGLDLKGAMRVGFLQARNVKFSNVAANMVVNNGRLDLNPLSAELYGGRIGGSLTAQADGNRVAVKQTMDNVAIGPLMKDYAQKDVLEGRGRFALDVSASGSSVAAVRQSLSGSAAMSLRDGAVKGINLAKSLRQAKALLRGGKQDAVVAANKAEKTDFSELTASFRITNGVARNDDLSAKSPFLRVAGAGTIDLVRGQLDYLAKATVVASAKGQEGQELADLNGLTVPVRLTGPIDDPAYRIEVGALATEAAKQQVEKRVGEQVRKQLGKEGVGKALKGLIK
jgi:AsmA protein